MFLEYLVIYFALIVLRAQISYSNDPKNFTVIAKYNKKLYSF